MRADIHPVASLDRLIGRHPELGERIESLGVPLWLFLDRVDDYFEVADGWAAAPSTADAKKATGDLLAEFTSPHGVAGLDALADAGELPAGELAQWLTSCGYEIFRGSVLTRVRSAPDHVAGILEVLGEACSAEDLREYTGGKRTRATIVNALGPDERFVRAGKSTYALAEWGVDQYVSVRSAIGRLVDARPGGVPLAEVVESICTSSDVAPSSVQTYASVNEFEVVAGIVRRRTSRAVPRKTPAQSRNVFRLADGLGLAITVSRDHLRGSGTPVPAAVAAHVGCGQGETVDLESDEGPVTVRFTNLQPTIGTVRRFLDGVSEGERLFLVFGDDGRFRVRRPTVPVPATALTGALAHVGHPDPAAVPEEDTAVTIARAIWLESEDRPRRILSACRGRGDEELIEMLEKAWVRPSAE